jgi:hypothetical protein
MTPTISPLDSLLEKLMRAGWVSSAATLDRQGHRVRGVLWTDNGLRDSIAVGMLIQPIGELSEAEWMAFRHLILNHLSKE